MMSMLRSFSHHVFPASRGKAALVAFIYGWIALQGVLFFSDREILWGIHNVFFRYGQSDRFIENAMLRLYYQPEISPLIYYTHLAASLLGMFNRSWSFVPRLIAWISGLLLYNAASTAYGWSMPLMLSMAFIAAFMYSEKRHGWRSVLTSVLLWALRVQGIIFFIATALFQWGATQWLAGNAFYYQWHLDFLFRQNLQNWRASLSSFALVFTYAWMLYCSAFPLLIWFKKTRSILVGTGVCFALIFTLTWSNAMNGIALVALLLPWILEQQD